MLNEKGVKCWKGSQITNKVLMLNEKSLKCWEGPQKLVKMSNLVTVKIPLRSQFLVKVSNLR